MKSDELSDVALSNALSLIHPAATALLDEQLTIVQISPGFDRLIGAVEEQLEGAPLSDVLWEFVGVEEDLKAILKGESERFVLENVNRHTPDGGDRYLSFQVMANLEQASPSTLLLIVEDRSDVGRLQQSLIQDRNELRLARRELAGLNVELAQLNRLKSLFLSIAAHDMRTPLASIQGYAELLRDGLAVRGLSREDLLDVILSQAYRLQQLINDVLDLDQVERGEISVFRRDSHMGEIVTEVVTALRPLSQRAGVAIHVVISNKPIRIFVDPQRVSQMLYNLLGNALKFTPAGGHIRLSVTENDENVFITVADNGRGISESALERLFEPYFQEGQLDQKDGKSGTGLGLYIVKLLVDAHNGEITVDSTPGKGTEFFILLPKTQPTGG